MDREGFRNRLNQYKKAREENPGLKYWEWKAQPAEKDIPKYDEGAGSVGMPSTTSRDGRTKYVYYDPTMDLEYQNINLPEVTITGNKNAGKRLPMQVPKGSYERFKTLGEIGKTVGGFLPVVGEMIDAYDLTTDIKNKDWTNTAVRVGSYFVPNIIEKSANLIKTGIKGLRKYPTIDVNTAHKITDKQWDIAYDQALQANDKTELLRLRDLHFSAKSNTVVKDKNGIPIETYHTVGDLYNPNFTKFNPTIEGTRSAIYTADDKLMSGSYSNSYTSKEELEELHKIFVEKGLSSSMDETYEFVRNLGLWEPQRQKKLYISLHNPAEIDADSRNWNFITKGKLPEKLYDLSFKFPFLRNADVVTTRDVENLYRRAKDYDGAIIKNVRDYGGGKFLSPEFSPHTVFEVENPANLKLSDAVTYDDVGKVIPLSKRDNFNNPDIRYSIAPLGLVGLTRFNSLQEKRKNNRYAEGGQVEPNKYRIVTKDPTLKSQIQSAVDWTNKWHTARKATGKFDDQYKSTEPYANRPTAILPSNTGDTAGTFTGSLKSALVRVNPNVTPQWGNSLESAVVHELGETSIENAAAKMSADKARSSAIVKKVSEITGSPEFHTTEQGSDYYNTAAEEYARLQQMRHAINADPTKEYSLPELKSWLKQYQLPADERGVRLMNDVAAADIPMFDNRQFLAEGGVVKIKEKNKGKFTASAKRAGMGVLEFARHVLANKDDYSSTQIKRANFARNASKWKHAEGTDQVQLNPLEVLERSRPRVAGIPINDRPLSGTDPIGEAMMWGLGGGAASAALRSLFPTYGATAGWLAFGDNNKDNMLVVPNNPVKNTTPIETGLLNKEVRQYYADDVLPRDILTSEADKLRFLNTDKNFEYDLYPQAYFSNGVAGHYDRLNDKIRLNGGYTSNKDLLDNVMVHEVNHRYNREFPLDKEHNRILNRAYTVEPDLDTPAARAARKPSEKRATNVNIRHRLQTDLRDTLGHNPTKAEMDKFIDSLSDLELLDRLGSASSYGSAYLMSIEDRADLVKQPVDQYKKARTTALRKALKRIAMNENKNDNNQNYA